MITIVTSTRKPSKDFEEHIIKTSGLGKNIEVLEYQNNGEYSLTQIYNKGLKEAKYDIIVFMHDDIHFNRNSWGNRLLKNFRQNPEYGILGVAGTTELNETGTWWTRKEKMYGRVSHRDVASGKTWDSNFSKDMGNSIKEMVVLDGVLFAVDKRKIKYGFNEAFTGFHFYDISFCFENFLAGVKVGVFTNIRITHDSVGQTNDKWEENRDQFVNMFRPQLPKSVKINIPYNDISIVLPNEPKLSIIIPTKDKYEMVSACLNSILNKTNYVNYKIYIADTGSSETVKKLFRKNFIEKHDNVKLIEYDYYNFAKINNDVVKKHIDTDTELVLFCNNDIELINDSISVMVKCYLDNKESVGTIGCRLHFENGTIQHMGILAYNKDGGLGLTHSGLNYDFNEINVDDTIKLYGNTAAFLMMPKDLFLKYGCFNEEYEICFEDVELNFRALIDGKTNYTCTNAVNYHYESQTRGKTISQNDYLRIVAYTNDSGLVRHLKTV